MSIANKILFFAAAAIASVVLLFPVKTELGDGGSVRWKALTYEITKYSRPDLKNGTVTGGWKIDILGIEICKKQYPAGYVIID